MNSVTLTDEELSVLDGRCRAETQAIVDGAKRRLQMAIALATTPTEHAGFISDVVSYAIANGRLGFTWWDLNSCKLCGKRGGYLPLKRTSGKGRKGGPYDRPTYVRGVELAHQGFIRVRHYAALGCCTECFEALKPALAEQLAGIKAAIPEQITGVKPRFVRYDMRKCTKCGWTGNEGKMRMLESIMGGKYPGGCPSCDAANKPFGQTMIVSADGFELVEASQ